MIDYTIFYKRELSISDAWSLDEQWDLFISAYVPALRTKRVFDKAHATHKQWLLFPEYGYDKTEYPSGEVFDGSSDDEATFIANFWKTLPRNAESLRICIDITGFIRPYLIYLVRWLVEKGVQRFDAIYSEPIKYDKRELTEFSGDIVKEVRQVEGCEGNHTTDITKDLLIIGVGYEDNLISHVAESKAKATKLQLIGFPSLRADMYQENILRVRRAEESLGGTVDDEGHSFFAPANDPFVAATELSRIVSDWKARKGITNLYLCPLSTKAHVLGFALFYLTECRNTATSIIFPFEERYSQNTSIGIARIWKYTVELPPK
jgi:hypothetical protein